MQVGDPDAVATAEIGDGPSDPERPIDPARGQRGARTELRALGRDRRIIAQRIEEQACRSLRIRVHPGEALIATALSLARGGHAFANDRRGLPARA